MIESAPQYVLISQARLSCHPEQETAVGRGGRRWFFRLQAADGSSRLEASDEEPGAGSDRLDLLAVVRGLEALDQPSQVTLVTTSRYVQRGLRFGLEAWRDNDWHWERYGHLAPVKNHDLWRRVDRALQYHEVECRIWRIDSTDDFSSPRPRRPHFLRRRSRSTSAAVPVAAASQSPSVASSRRRPSLPKPGSAEVLRRGWQAARSGLEQLVSGSRRRAAVAAT